MRLKKVTELTIDREKWARAGKRKTNGRSQLQNEKGCRCCLGSLCFAMGVPEIDLKGTEYPEELCRSVPGLTIPGSYFNTPFSINAMETNDHSRGDSMERKLKKLFKKNGIKLSFRGKK